MTRLVVNAGSCGNEIVVEVEALAGEKAAGRSVKGPGHFSLSIETDCEFVAALAADLPVLTTMDAFTGILENRVYRAAGIRLKHPACPVPSGILKALEVAAGMNVPRDVSMVFKKRGGDG